MLEKTSNENAMYVLIYSTGLIVFIYGIENLSIKRDIYFKRFLNANNKKCIYSFTIKTKFL